jgi:FKBP-type peptidyl-prolyl cis-trans isomerase SlyD
MDIGMQALKNNFVIIEYTVCLEDGSFIKGENGPASLNFVVGFNQILPSLERRLSGMSIGEEANFVIPAQEAFGNHDPGQVRTMNLEDFPKGVGMVEGEWVLAANEETQAQYSYFVKEKTDRTVTLDFNHPLAGKDLYYKVKVIHVRPALIEELEQLRPCEYGNESKADEEHPHAVS